MGCPFKFPEPYGFAEGVIRTCAFVITGFSASA